MSPKEEEEAEVEKEDAAHVREEGNQQGDCIDGEDNDEDGFVDCEDNGCANTPACTDISEPSSEPSGEPSGEPSVDCGIQIDDTFPVTGTSDFYYRDTLAFELSDDDDSASLSLEDAGGTVISGTSSVDGDMVYFTPSVPLQPSTSYVAKLSYCGSEVPVDVSFSTSDLGTVADDLGVFEGKTYALDISSGNFVQPPGVGDLIGGLLDNNILIGVTAATETSMSLIGAISFAGSTEQDTCQETLDIPDADFSDNPYFEIDIPEGIEMNAAGVIISLDSLFISGSFSTDGTYFGGGELVGELDVRKLTPLLEDLIQSDDPAESCSLLLGFGVTCETCSSDSEPFCIPLEVNGLNAEDTGQEIITRTNEDIQVDSSCN